MRRLVLLLPVVAAAVVAANAAAAGLPDPCSVLSQGAVNAAFGASSDNQEFGTPGSAKAHGVTAQTCTFTYGNAEIVVTVAKKGYAPTTPAGTTKHAAAGFPAGSQLLANKHIGSAFNAVAFTKGSRFGEVWATSAVSAPHVLKLGRLLLAKL
jgi:hypothetical protein